MKRLLVMVPHWLGRASIAAAFLVVGACGLQPAARVANATTLASAAPEREAPVVPLVEERYEPRAVAMSPPSDAADESASKPSSSARARQPRKPPATGGKSSPNASQDEVVAEVSPPEPPAADVAKSFERPPSLELDARELDARSCGALLDEHGVAYEVKEGASPEHLYVRPKGAIGGVYYAFEGRRQVHEVMDCRLVVALLQWAPALRREGVRKIRHLSVYRPDARVAVSGKPSGHASALAIDVRFLDFEDGRTLDVLTDWGNRTPNVMPCDEGVGEADPTPELRRITCELVEAELFQTVITPHRDQLHENHVHIELVPDAEWTFIR